LALLLMPLFAAVMAALYAAAPFSSAVCMKNRALSVLAA